MRMSLMWVMVGGLVCSCAAIPKPSPSSPEAGDTAGVSFQLLAAGPEGGAAQGLANRAELASGTRVALRLVPEVPGYVYLWHRGADTKALPERLAPPPGGNAIRSLPRAPLALPAEGQWYKLDDQPGKEVFYLVASRQPLDGPAQEALLATIPDEREPPTSSTGNRDGGVTYRVAMDASGVARFAFVLLHR